MSMYHTTVMLWTLSCFASAILAIWDNTFIPSQMRYSHKIGFPYIRHTAMWANLFIMTWPLALIAQYMDQWEPAQILHKFIIAAGISLVLHIMWSAMTDRQEHMLSPGLNFKSSALINNFQMMFALGFAMLFYLNTNDVDRQDAVTITWLLLAYQPFGTALVGFAKSRKFDVPGVLATIAIMMVILYAHVSRFGSLLL